MGRAKQKSKPGKEEVEDGGDGREVLEAPAGLAAAVEWTVAEANNELIASTSSRPRRGSGGLRMEEECRGGKGEKLSPRRSTGSEAKGEADTRAVVSAVTPRPEGGASLLRGPGLPQQLWWRSTQRETEARTTPGGTPSCCWCWGRWRPGAGESGR